MVGCVVQAFVFPNLQRRYDNIKLYRALMLLWPLAFASLPALSYIARKTAPSEFLLQAATDVLSDGIEAAASAATYPAGVFVWFGIGVSLALLRLGHMCFA